MAGMVFGPVVTRPFGIANDAQSQGSRDYSVIIARNPFGLRAPRPPKKVPTTAVQPRNTILLTGITSFGPPRAYFMSKPSLGYAPEYYDLRVGEAKDGFEVLKIDPVTKSVRVRNAGIETVMTFQANGVEASSADSRGAGLIAGSLYTTKDPFRGISVSSGMRSVPLRNSWSAFH
jgi:hypothetical protein